MSVILAARRTAVVPRGGAFARLSIEDLGAPVVRAVLQDAGLPASCVDDLICANALGAGGNPARRVALAAGLPDRVAGLTVDRQCVGGLDAILLAHAMITAGLAEVIVAGGVESYSRRPLRLRTDPEGGPPQPYDQAPFTPWPDRDPDMAVAAAALALRLGISRAEQDDWAVGSHHKALSAQKDGSSGGIVVLEGQTHDAFTRALTPALAARAKPLAGSVTAANAAVAADAAAFVLVVSDRMAAGHGLRIVGGATRGAAPDEPGLAPIAAIAATLAQAGLTPADLTRTEVMEAYAVQAIACVKGAGLDPARVNMGGGALARGHPIGASGAILAVRLFHDMTLGPALATIAAAGGIGSALVVERSGGVSCVTAEPRGASGRWPW